MIQMTRRRALGNRQGKFSINPIGTGTAQWLSAFVDPAIFSPFCGLPSTTLTPALFSLPKNSPIKQFMEENTYSIPQYPLGFSSAVELSARKGEVHASIFRP